MQSNTLPQAEKYTKRNQRRKIWQKIVGSLACVVVFVTTYMLILPAITLSHEPICGLEEHAHTEECYTTQLCYPQASMDCTLESNGAWVIHTHDSFCYSQDGTLICTLSELEAHSHTSRCYREERTLICPEEEDLGHEHSSACYARQQGVLICTEAEDEGHTHTDSCFEVERVLTCDDESEDHVHDDGCYTETSRLVCTEDSRPGHIHDDSCYEWTEELICSEAERPAGHVHTDACYEVTTELDCGYEEVIPHTHGEDCYDENGILVCVTEEVLEHQHTADCIVPPEGEPWEIEVLTCGLEEHTHTEECYADSEEGLLPGSQDPGAESDYICGLEEHTHTEACYAPDGELVCTLEEHIHGEECLELLPVEEASDDTAYVCGLEAHAHDETCYDEAGELICGLEEHSHDLDCLTAEGREQVGEVISLIDALPASEEAEEALAAFEEAEDWEGYESYYQSVGQQARYAYARYEALPEALRAQVSNADKLMELEWLWGAATWEMPADAEKVTNETQLVNAAVNGAYIVLDGDFSASGIALPDNAAVTVDLNGHTLTAAGTLFTVPAGTALTIVDSLQKEETVETVSGDMAGNTASLSGSTLTYYVTATEVTNSATGATAETLEKHTVTAAGAIAGGTQPVFKVTGGTLTLESGMIRGGTGRAVNQTGGETRLTGGYICGFTQSSTSTANTDAFGGAIRVTGGTLELSGGVLAGNTAQNGGAVYASGGRIVITGGVISGNTADRVPTNGWNGHSESGAYRCGGGGIYADGSTEITMSGGWITNNQATDTGYFDGGGGVCLSGASAMELSGGYVTGNQAQGGGGIRTDFGKEAVFSMTGGFVTANVATTAEGGGVTIDRNGVGTITSGYITNNVIIETVHWGGGGLFCADGSTLNLKYTLITENEAGGFGGGVAGCPTGKIYLYITDGCAIYGNEDVVDDDSPHFVNGGVKNDIDVNRCTEVFQSNGHADYFCALNSTVTGTMLGGNAANWQGSADYQPVIADAEDLLSATEVMGLQAHPTEEGKAAAQAAARVYINGNYSYTHGGGILCNGNLVIGVPVDIEVPARVELQATKSFRNQNGVAASMEGNDFSFRVTMTEVDGTVIANGVCDSSGKIAFDHQLTFKQAGTFVYYVYEEAGGDPLVEYDSTLYRLTMTVARDSGTPWYGETIKYTYSVTSMKVESSKDDGGTWTTLSSDSTAQSGVISLPLTEGATFTNIITEVTKLTVRKEWAGGSGADSVTVILKQDGEEFDQQTLSEDNGWMYTWDNLEAGHSYTVEEVEVPGYTASYEAVTETDGSEQASLGQGSWWVPATELTAGQQYLIVSPDGTKALKVASGGEGDGFNAADVTAVVQQQTAITVNGQTYSTWYQAADISARSIYNAENLTRNSHSGVILKRSDGGSYPYLRLESNSNNYLKGGSKTDYASFLVFDGTYLRGHNASEWTPDNLRTIVFADGKFNSTTEQNPANAVKLYTLVSGEGFTSGGSGSSTVVITNTPDDAGSYELPQTGGPGTHWYTLGGLCLMAGAFLLYFRRKGE